MNGERQREAKYPAYEIGRVVEGQLEQRVITLLSDFGLRDPYVAEMKATILGVCPQVQIVDVSHNVEQFDIRMGAFLLASAAPYFPDGTVHVAVVDPGVGTKRKPIVVETSRSLFVGPDNGVLMLAALREGVQHVYAIENPRFMRLRISTTFHGRDVFAPAAAHLACGCAASDFGRAVDDYVIPEFSKPRMQKSVLMGTVLHIDAFGNIVTNISSDSLEKMAGRTMETLKADLGGQTAVLKVCTAYGDVARGNALVLVGSHDFLEISVNQGDAAKQFAVKRGDPIRIWQPR